jgi:hypothetical protein
MSHHEHQSIYPTGSLRGDFEGPEGGPTAVVITDLRGATSAGTGIVEHWGKKKHANARAAEEAGWATIAKMTGHTVEELKSGEFYQSR